MNASFTWPAKRPVFMITRRATRSGFSTAQRSPIGPPQSWTTTVASAHVELLEQLRHVARRGGRSVYQSRSVGLSERPKPG